MNIFHGDLKTIKASCLGNLNLGTKLLCKIFKNYSITCGEKSKHIFYKMLLVCIKFCPIFQILIEIYLVCCPKRSQMLLIHIIYGMIFYREKNKSLLIRFENRLIYFRKSENVDGLHFDLIQMLSKIQN